jgi:hypothetical protein
MEQKLDGTSQIVTSRVDAEEKAMLDRAVLLSGRSQSDVIRRLIQLINTPTGRAILGIVDPKPIEYTWKPE